MNALTTDQIKAQAIGRQVIYLVGSADTGTADLDMGCAANWQGVNRYVRAMAMHNYMKKFYPTAPHQLLVVPNVAHSSSVYTSTLGMQALFPSQ
jgi:hypothetical protein